MNINYLHAETRLLFLYIVRLSFLCGGIKIKEMIEQLDKEYKAKLAEVSKVSDKIAKHLHDKYDANLGNYSDFDEFLCDINEYAGDSIAKLLYISHAKTVICGEANEA